MANNNFDEEQMKKNMVSSGSGLDGLLGGAQGSKEEEKVADTATTTTQEVDSPAPETEQQPVAPKKPRKAGRRKKVEKESGKGRHLTIVLDEQLVNKAKIAAVYDGILLKDVIREALTDWLAKWERKNGAITPPKWGQDQ